MSKEKARLRLFIDEEIDSLDTHPPLVIFEAPLPEVQPVKQPTAKRPHLDSEFSLQIKNEQHSCCGVCGCKKENEKLRIHHIKPVSHHKPSEEPYVNRRENLIALCPPCHTVADKHALNHLYLNMLADPKDILTIALPDNMSEDSKSRRHVKKNPTRYNPGEQTHVFMRGRTN